MKSYTESTDAARYVIGCLYLESGRTLTALVCRGIGPQNFPPEFHDAVADSIARFAANKIVSPLTMQASMPAGSDPIALDRCADSVTTIEHLDHYLDRMQSERLCLDIKTAQADAQHLAETATPDRAEECLTEIRARWGTVGGAAVNTESLGAVALRMIEEWRKPVEMRGGCGWPLRDLNKHIGPLATEYVVIAAHESVGKTAFACNMALCNAHAGRRAAIKYIEAKREQIVPRLIGALARINTLDLRRGKGNEFHFSMAEDAAAKIDTLPLSVDDALCTPEQLLAWAQLEKAKGARLLIVDNMKHITIRERTNSMPEVFRAISLGVKRVRDATGLPVILLHHLSGDDDVSWSRDVRRDADVMIFMKTDATRTIKPSKANGWHGTWWVNFEVEKNRDGLAGFTVQGQFEKETQTFVDDIDAEPGTKGEPVNGCEDLST